MVNGEKKEDGPKLKFQLKLMWKRHFTENRYAFRRSVDNKAICQCIVITPFVKRYEQLM